MAQPRPASDVEDHLPAADRESLDDCLAVALHGACLPIVGAGMLPVSPPAAPAPPPAQTGPELVDSLMTTHLVSLWGTLFC